MTEIFSATSSHGPKILLADWNARLYRRLPGEDDIIGPYIFDNPDAIIAGDSNRNLLLELCVWADLTISNTFHEVDQEKMVTCYNIGFQAMSEISWRAHSQIDFFLCPSDWKHVVERVWSDRSMPLASHHFPVFAHLQISVSKDERTNASHNHFSCAALLDPLAANRFADLFDKCMEDSSFSGSEDLNLKYACMVDAFKTAEAETLTKRTVKPRKPWISSMTLVLIEQRQICRQSGNRDEEAQLNKQVRASVKRDRTRWLEAMLETGDWKEIRKLRKGHSPAQGRLKNASGELVSSELRAETLATHLETVQWAVRPAVTVPELEPIHSQLPANSEVISEKEVIDAARKLKRDRARGPDDVPPEYWKTILSDGCLAARWAVEFCQECWRQKSIPDAWYDARVVAIF